MNRLIARLHDDEGGAALLCVLAFIVFIGVMTPPLLNYTSTNLRATVKLRELRGEQYAADAVAELAIAETQQQAGSDRVSGLHCYDGTGSDVNGKVLHADCTSTDFMKMTFTVCYAPCNPADVRLVTDVRYASTAAGSPVSVTSWSVRK